MRIKSYVGLIISIIGFMLLTGVSFGIYADVGSGAYHLYFLLLLIPLFLCFYSIKKNNIKLTRIAFFTSLLLSFLLIFTLYQIDKQPFSLVYDLYQNIYSIYIGTALILLGYLVSILNVK